MRGRRSDVVRPSAAKPHSEERVSMAYRALFIRAIGSLESVGSYMEVYSQYKYLCAFLYVYFRSFVGFFSFSNFKLPITSQAVA